MLDSQAFKSNQKLVSKLNQKIYLQKKELEEMRANKPVDINHNCKEEENQIQDSMLQMASGMKQYANNFKT